MVLKRSRNRLQKRLILGLLVLVLLVIVLIVANSLYQSHKRQHRVVIPSTAPTQSTAPSNSSGTSDKQTAPASGSNAPSTDKSTSVSGPVPLTPTGQFVSNHHPGGNNPTTEQSVCNTTPGASCYIAFTKDGVTKKLSAQTTDSNGTTIWNWDVKAAGLTAGSWQVSATATLNGQTKTAVDSAALEIGS